MTNLGDCNNVAVVNSGSLKGKNIRYVIAIVAFVVSAVILYLPVVYIVSWLMFGVITVKSFIDGFAGMKKNVFDIVAVSLFCIIWFSGSVIMAKLLCRFNNRFLRRSC